MACAAGAGMREEAESEAREMSLSQAGTGLEYHWLWGAWWSHGSVPQFLICRMGTIGSPPWGFPEDSGTDS